MIRAYFSGDGPYPVDNDRLQISVMNGETSVMHSLSNHEGQEFSDVYLFGAADMTLTTSSALIGENSLRRQPGVDE